MAELPIENFKDGCVNRVDDASCTTPFLFSKIHRASHLPSLVNTSENGASKENVGPGFAVKNSTDYWMSSEPHLSLGNENAGPVAGATGG